MRSSEALLSQRRLFVQAPPDVRVVARRLRQIDLLCDVTLVFNEDESDADVPIDAAEADEKAAPLLAHKLILAASSTYFYEVFGKVTSTGMLKLWLPPPISRAAMSVILDWMYGVDVHGALLVEDVGYLREVKESAEVLQLTTFIQSIQDILDALAQDCPEPESEPVSHNRYGFDSSNIDETSLAIKSEIVDDESASGRASAASASVFRKRKLDPCLRASAAPSSSASTGLSTEELMFQDKMIRLVGGQYQCKDCGQIFSRFSSFKFHRNIKHNDDRQAKEPASKRGRMEAATPTTSERPDGTFKSLPHPQLPPASSTATQRASNFETRARRASSPYQPIQIDEEDDKSLAAAPSTLTNRKSKKTGQKMTLDELRRTLCPRSVSISAGDFQCHLCPMFIRGGKYACLAVSKHMHRSHDIICRPNALPCPDCNYVSWCANLTNHLKSGACKYYPKSRQRQQRGFILFRGKSMQLKDLKADYGFLTMKRNGEWVCPVKSCDYRLFKDDYSNSTFVTRNAAMHMLEEHNHLLEFYACYCYLCPNVSFAQATMNQHMIQTHSDMDERYTLPVSTTNQPEPTRSISTSTTADTAHKSLTLTLPLISTTKKLTHIAPTGPLPPSALTSFAPPVVIDLSKKTTTTTTTPKGSHSPPSSAAAAAAVAKAAAQAAAAVLTSSSATASASSTSAASPASSDVTPMDAADASDSATPESFQSSASPRPNNSFRGTTREGGGAGGGGGSGRRGASIGKSPQRQSRLIKSPGRPNGGIPSSMNWQVDESSGENSTAGDVANSEDPLTTALKSSGLMPSFSVEGTASAASNASSDAAAAIDASAETFASAIVDTSTLSTEEIIAEATKKITDSLIEQTGNDVNDSQEVHDSIHSVLKSLVDGGLLADQDTGGEDKVLQIEMDLPKYPGLVIQVPASLLRPATKSKNRRNTPSLPNGTAKATPPPSASPSTTLPRTAPPLTASVTSSSSSATSAISGLTSSANPDTSSKTATPETTMAAMTTADASVQQSVSNSLSGTTTSQQSTASLASATKTTASPRRQATMSGSVVHGDQGLTLMTPAGLIRLPAGTQQVQNANGGLHIQLPPGMTLADIGL